jgi:hypothetical protein
MAATTVDTQQPHPVSFTRLKAGSKRKTATIPSDPATGASAGAASSSLGASAGASGDAEETLLSLHHLLSAALPPPLAAELPSAASKQEKGSDEKESNHAANDKAVLRVNQRAQKDQTSEANTSEANASEAKQAAKPAAFRSRAVEHARSRAAALFEVPKPSPMPPSADGERALLRVKLSRALADLALCAPAAHCVQLVHAAATALFKDLAVADVRVRALRSDRNDRNDRNDGAAPEARRLRLMYLLRDLVGDERFKSSAIRNFLADALLPAEDESTAEVCFDGDCAHVFDRLNDHGYCPYNTAEDLPDDGRLPSESAGADDASSGSEERDGGNSDADDRGSDDAPESGDDSGNDSDAQKSDGDNASDSDDAHKSDGQVSRNTDGEAQGDNRNRKRARPNDSGADAPAPRREAGDQKDKQAADGKAGTMESPSDTASAAASAGVATACGAPESVRARFDAFCLACRAVKERLVQEADYARGLSTCVIGRRLRHKSLLDRKKAFDPLVEFDDSATLDQTVAHAHVRQLHTLLRLARRACACLAPARDLLRPYIEPVHTEQELEDDAKALSDHLTACILRLRTSRPARVTDADVKAVDDVLRQHGLCVECLALKKHRYSTCTNPHPTAPAPATAPGGAAPLAAIKATKPPKRAGGSRTK